MLSTLRGGLGICVAVMFMAALSASAQDAPKKHIPLQKTVGKVTPTGPAPSLFVLNSDGATLADGKLTLTGVSANSITFADRPVRAAGHVMTSQFIQQWDEGKDNFAIDPPNATVSILGGKGSDVSDAVVTLTKPVLDGTTLTFDVRVLEGSLAGSGPAAVFIDDRGSGGGGGGGDRGASSQHSGQDLDDGYDSNYYHQPEYQGAWYKTGNSSNGLTPDCGYGDLPDC